MDVVLKGVVRTVIHVDMDAFFASVEQRDDPQAARKARARGRLVSSRCGRGRIVRSAGIWCALCNPHDESPALVPERSRRARAATSRVYIEVSRAGLRHFSPLYTPLVEGLSIDEAFLDITAKSSTFW